MEIKILGSCLFRHFHHNIRVFLVTHCNCNYGTCVYDFWHYQGSRLWLAPIENHVNENAEFMDFCARVWRLVGIGALGFFTVEGNQYSHISHKFMLFLL